MRRDDLVDRGGIAREMLGDVHGLPFGFAGS
jgi:hypothetical protein